MTRKDGLLRHKQHLLERDDTFAVSPDVLDFGDLLWKHPKSRTIALQNLGPAMSRCRFLPIDARLDVTIGFERHTTKVAPGMRHKITVTLGANRVGPVDGELVLLAGEKEEYRIGLRGVVVTELVKPPEPEWEEDLLKLVPRLPNTFFNWKESRLVLETASAFPMDHDLSLQEVIDMHEARMSARASAALPPYCVRLDERADVDEKASADQERHSPEMDSGVLDPNIFLFLQGLRSEETVGPKTEHK